MAAIAGAGFVLAQVELPPEEPPLQSSFVCAADVDGSCGADNAIAKFAGVEDRVSVPVEEMPRIFINAVLAAEDRTFFSHSGIDPVGIARALYRDLRNEGVQQGGSTITQQYAKNEFLSSERTLTRKLKEAVLAIKLERELSKEEILGRYLNGIYYGRGAYGAEAAARAYFGVSIRDVDLSQAAYLAALIRSPESADATRDPDVANFRRDAVLAGMLDEGWITEAERAQAASTRVEDQVLDRTVRDGLTMLRGEDVGASYYVEYARRLLYDKYGADVVNGGGLRVYLALDLDRQAAAYDAVWGLLDQADDPAGALVSVDDLGRVVTMVGGRDFSTSQVNLALGSLGGGTGRQPGSSFKPIVLATALEQGMSVYSRFLDEYEMVYPKADGGKDWTVHDYAERPPEVIDLVEATRRSSNNVFVQLLMEVGPNNAVRIANELGIESDLPVVNSLVLGSGEVSVLDMASAYSTFARRGKAIEPILITRVEQVVDGEVRVLESASTKVSYPISTDTADQVNYVLRQVVLGGTGSAANLGVPIAGKTGTTTDYRDAWFVGYTPELTTAVWMGYPDADENGSPRYMRDVRGRRVTGGSFPAQIWRAYMAAVLDADGGTHGSFVAPARFTGDVFNEDLTTTTSSLPPCGPDDAADPDTSATSEPCEPTTTTTEPGDGSTTTTSDPDAATTTTAGDGSTTTEPDSTTTSTPPPTTTEPAPTTTEFLGE